MASPNPHYHYTPDYPNPSHHISAPSPAPVAVMEIINTDIAAETALESIESDIPRRSKIVTLRLLRYKDALKNLGKTRRDPTSTIPIPVEIATCFTKDSNPPESSVFISLETYVSWLLEDPDPDPPALWQAPIPSQLTAFEFSGLYNTGECMDGCSGSSPGTGCPICKPVDFKDIMQLYGSHGGQD